MTEFPALGTRGALIWGGGSTPRGLFTWSSSFLEYYSPLTNYYFPPPCLRHVRCCRAGMQHKGMAQQQKEQMLRLTPEDFPTLSPAGYKVRTCVPASLGPVSPSGPVDGCHAMLGLLFL